MSNLRFAVITMSDSGSRGEREDTSGAALKDLFETSGYRLCCYRIIPDHIDTIVQTVKDAVDRDHADLVLTTGGTGVAPTDVTPEAMNQVFDKEVPGIAEAMRAESLKITPRSVISRSRAGIYRSCLIINLPGSRKAALENITVVMAALEHAIEKIKGSTADCGQN
ncbi:MAG: MogA/MoaB family molybdenum cofactor biosynthesis protein [Desulfofustis sp.]|jgi:molybdenum cofactor synthesis domain-containing protein|nr:MogA/MoaB family molybdenum cofactor biosynthesis protein [Desulfofustis sp.]